MDPTSSNRVDDGRVVEPTITFVMVSGARLDVQKIFLCEESQLKKAQMLRFAAASDLTGGSNAVGVFGAPAWVLAGAALFGALHSLATSRAASESIAKLREADLLFSAAKDEGVFIPVDQIDGVHLPQPGSWRGLVKLESATSGYRSFVHDGEPFLHVFVPHKGYLSLAWDKVESYVPPPTVRLTVEQKMDEYDISFDGKQYRFGGMSYSRLDDAINYAESQKRRALGR